MISCAHESFWRVRSILEALVVGTPVLVTPGVGLATVVRDNDIGYVANLDIEAITQTLDRHLANPDRAKSLGINARQFSLENYNWDKIAIDLIQIYRDLFASDTFSQPDDRGRDNS